MCPTPPCEYTFENGELKEGITGGYTLEVNLKSAEALKSQKHVVYMIERTSKMVDRCTNYIFAGNWDMTFTCHELLTNLDVTLTNFRD